MPEYIVSLKKDIDYEAFHNEMTSEAGTGPIPNRPVSVVNERVGNPRLFHYELTKAEAVLLRLDQRVIAVEIESTTNPFITHTLNALQVENFQKPDTRWWETYVNWGLRRCNSIENPYDANGTPSDNNFAYSLDGTDVDIVVMDSGIQLDHPEFITDDKRNRIQSINWPEAAGLPGILQPQSHYTDPDGHGTHVASIVAGKTFGWAKNANIYPMHINLGRDTTGFNIADAFDLILNWHKKKTNGRPTIVNMSWGTTVTVNSAAKILGGIYRGTEWSFSDQGIDKQYLNDNFGIVKYTDNNLRFPGQVTSYDVATEELIDAGIHVVIAAGNIPVKCDIETGLDYNNTIYFQDGSGTYVQPTNRPMSPYSQKAITVGAVDSSITEDGEDQVWDRSARGPVIDTFAPGENIMAAYTSNPVLVFRPNGTYFKNQKYRQTPLSGTSQAAPQVAGYISYIVQQHPTISPSDVKQKIRLESSKVMVDTIDNDDWTNRTGSLWGSLPNLMYNRFNNSDVGEYINLPYVNFERSSIHPLDGQPQSQTPTPGGQTPPPPPEDDDNDFDVGY